MLISLIDELKYGKNFYKLKNCDCINIIKLTFFKQYRNKCTNPEINLIININKKFLYFFICKC